MSTNTPTGTASPTSPQTPAHKLKPVRVIQNRSPQYVTLACDGAWGMVTSSGNIQLELFVDHPPIPSEVVYPLENGTISQEFKEKYKDREEDETHFLVVREIQVGVSITLQTAMQIHAVLTNFINLVAAQNKILPPQTKPNP